MSLYKVTLHIDAQFCCYVRAVDRAQAEEEARTKLRSWPSLELRPSSDPRAIRLGELVEVTPSEPPRVMVEGDL